MPATSYTFSAASTTLIAAAQTTAGSGSFILNGSGRDQNSPVPRVKLDSGWNRVVSLTSTGNISAVNFTITGLDVNGNAVSETRAGPNNNTVYTTAFYSVVLTVTVNGAVATATSVGSGDTGETQWWRLDNFQNPINVGIVNTVTGTINYTIKFTGTPFTYDISPSTPVALNHPDSTMVAATTSTNGNIAFGVTALKAIVNSSSGGTLISTFNQAGI